MKNRLLILAKLAFVVLLCVLVYFHKAQKPRILILHSYLNDYSWVEEINIGLERFFSEHEDVTLRYHYMDLKNHGDEAFRRTATEIARRTIDRWQPDVLVIFDDIGQRLVGMRYMSKSGISVVYGGVNAAEEDYGYNMASNVTGILERKPLKAVEDTVSMIWEATGGGRTQKPKVQLLGDASFSFQAGLTAYDPENYKFTKVRWKEPVAVETFDEWKEFVLGADKTNDVLLVSDYRQVKKAKGGKEFVLPREVMSWTEQNSPVPVLGLAAIITEEGGMMSVAASGYEQGEVAGRMAYEIAKKKKKASEIPNAETRQYLIGLRKSAIKRRELDVPSIYEAFARATDNFYE